MATLQYVLIHEPLHLFLIWTPQRVHTLACSMPLRPHEFLQLLHGQPHHWTTLSKSRHDAWKRFLGKDDGASNGLWFRPPISSIALTGICKAVRRQRCHPSWPHLLSNLCKSSCKAHTYPYPSSNPCLGHCLSSAWHGPHVYECSRIWWGGRRIHAR